MINCYFKDDFLYERSIPFSSLTSFLIKKHHQKMSLILNNQLIVIDHVVEQSFIDGSIILDRDKR